MSLSTKLVALTILSNVCIVFAYGHGLGFWGFYIFRFPIFSGNADFNFTGSIDDKLALVALFTNLAQLVLIFSTVLKGTSKNKNIYGLVGALIMLVCYIVTYYLLSNNPITLYLWTGIPFILFCTSLIYHCAKTLLD